MTRDEVFYILLQEQVLLQSGSLYVRVIHGQAYRSVRNKQGCIFSRKL